MVSEELANPFQASFRKYLMQVAVGDNSVSPFASDGVHGEVAGQNTYKNHSQGRVKANETEVEKKTAGEQGDFFRDGKAQSAEEKNQKEAGVDEGFGVIYEKDGNVRQGFAKPLQPIALGNGRLADFRRWRCFFGVFLLRR
jgi:hypothetical protein